MFFASYTKDGADPATRPITYTFNGGPGSSSIWLHMGAFGPKRVNYRDDEGHAAAPPYRPRAAAVEVVCIPGRCPLSWHDSMTELT